MPQTNIKSTDQPAHLHSLISASVVHLLDIGSVMPVLSRSKFSILWLVSAEEQPGLSSVWSQVA